MRSDGCKRGSRGGRGALLTGLVPALVAVTLAACGTGKIGEPGDSDEFEPISSQSERVSLLGQAYCSINVSGKGWKDTELDYLPHVIACENGGAGIEALRAQAIAARSVAYYNMASQGSICDGQGCQVYSCGASPSALHFQAVAETAQQYLSYGAMLTYGFYVAGDPNASGPSCVDGWSSTTKWVTYNDGKTGTQVTQSPLGYIGPPGFGQNRGCMSQWGGRCLEWQAGRDYLGILRYYYGGDIGITTAPGSCSTGGGAPPPPPPGPVCGDGSCNGNEECGSCPADCGACPSGPGPEPGAECDGKCGAQAASGCWCDAACSTYGDCCQSACSACGFCGGGTEPPPPPSGPVCGDGSCDSGESCDSCAGDCGACGSTCTATGHGGTGENGASCFDPAETWRCVWIPSWGAWGSQVCRYGVWTTFHLNPQDCGACCGGYNSGCSAY